MYPDVPRCPGRQELAILPEHDAQAVWVGTVGMLLALALQRKRKLVAPVKGFEGLHGLVGVGVGHAFEQEQR